MGPKFFYADYHPLPLPPKHRFPHEKYSMTRELLQQSLGFNEVWFHESPLAEPKYLRQVHDPEYVERVLRGDLTPQEQRKIGFPWSPELVNRCLASTGGTYAAAKHALNFGYSAQLAGGTHHAHKSHGAGYCVFNDFAYTIFMLRSFHEMGRIAVIDLDVHQGDGNVDILGNDEQTFIFSMHGEKNYPAKKPSSDLDIPLDDHTTDDDYLDLLEQALIKVGSFNPAFALYQAGVDPLRQDHLGRLSLSKEGLAKRDKMVFEFAKDRDIPIIHVLGGGYSRPIDHSVTAYVNTFAAAQQVFGF